MAAVFVTRRKNVSEAAMTDNEASAASAGRAYCRLDSRESGPRGLFAMRFFTTIKDAKRVEGVPAPGTPI